MPKIEQYAARQVYDPPAYSQAVKVSGAQTILFIAGQVAYDEKGGAAHPGEFVATPSGRPAFAGERPVTRSEAS